MAKKFAQTTCGLATEKSHDRISTEYVMWTTIQIKTLTEITQNYLSKESNQYLHSHYFNETISGHSKMEKGKSDCSPHYSGKRIRLPQNSAVIPNPLSNIALDNSCESSNRIVEIVTIDLQEMTDNNK